MGIDVTTGAFYGVSINFDEPANLPGLLKRADWDEIYNEFPSFGIPQSVLMLVGGNQMDGKRRLDILVRDSRYSVDKHGNTYPYTDTSAGFVRLADPNDDAIADLMEILHELNLSHLIDKIGWNFFTDIF